MSPIVYHYQKESGMCTACGKFERLNDPTRRMTDDPSKVTCQDCKGSSDVIRALRNE